MDLIQPNGQPNYGRFSALPRQIDLNQYVYKTPYGKVLTGWRKRLKYKKFKFCCIQHQHYTIGLAIADIAWAGHGFVYIYDHLKNEVTEWNAINFLSLNTVLDEQPLYSQSHFAKSGIQIDVQHANGVRYIQVSKHGELLYRSTSIPEPGAMALLGLGLAGIMVSRRGGNGHRAGLRGYLAAQGRAGAKTR